MSERLDPEVKALRAVDRALGALDEAERRRVLECARRINLPAEPADVYARLARLSETLRWLYIRTPGYAEEPRKLIVRALTEAGDQA